MSLAGSLRGYHVHIYYHDATEANAKDLHDQLVSRFGGQPSRPQFTGIAGPHPQMQVIFCKEAFTDLVPCLMFNDRDSIFWSTAHGCRSRGPHNTRGLARQAGWICSLIG